MSNHGPALSGSGNLRHVLCLYPDPPGFSGQRNASEMVIEGMKADSRFRCLPVKLPGLPASKKSFTGWFRFIRSACGAASFLVWQSLRNRPEGVFVALCQTNGTLIRERFLISILRVLTRNQRLPVVVRLDSSLFLSWNPASKIALRFKKLLHQSTRIVVLGPKQYEAVIKHYSVDDARVHIVPNASNISVASEDEVRAKHTGIGPISILHLGSLIESKGFAELIDAIPLLEQHISVVVCGRPTASRYDKRFPSTAEQIEWLLDRQDHLPQFRWVNGAVGEEKVELFRNAHLFVLPTYYPVEAQPLVLLEAIASGCVVVTTNVGEIPFMIDSSCGLILTDTSPHHIAETINQLSADSDRRIDLALRARDVLQNRFSESSLRQSWSNIFGEAFCDASEVEGKA